MPTSPDPTPAKAPLASLLREARRLRQSGRPDRAVPLWRQAALLAPADAAIRLELATDLLALGAVPEAIDSLNAAIRFDPRLAMAHHLLGRALAHQGNVVGAIEAQRATVALAPKLGDAQLRLAHLLLSRQQTEAAAAAFERAAAVHAGTSRGRVAAAWSLLARGRREPAIAALRRARALDPASLDAVRLLANTLVETGQFAEAEQLFRAAIALAPDAGLGYFELATLRRLAEPDRPLLARMATLLRQPGIGERDRIHLHFGLGKAHDDVGEYAAAIGHFDAANRLRRGNSKLDRATLTALVDRNIALFADAAAFAGAADADERPILVLGLPRSGTTLVEQILSSHPLVAAGGELGYWQEHGNLSIQPGAPRLTDAMLRELAAGYRTVLDGIAAGAPRVTDKNPYNFMYIGLLHRAFPGARIIHCVRHPVDTCLSMYTTFLAGRGNLFMTDRDDLVCYYREYARLMRHWRAVLPRERLLDIDYQAVTADRAAETRRLVAFCGLDWDAACLAPERNASGIATASRWQARQPVHRGSVGRWRNYRPWLGALAELLTEAERQE